MMNLLISLMTTTFSKIQRNADVEWKFTRASLWIHYYEVCRVFKNSNLNLWLKNMWENQDMNSLPVPFNMLPSVHSLTKLYRWWTGTQDDNAKIWTSTLLMYRIKFAQFPNKFNKKGPKEFSNPVQVPGQQPSPVRRSDRAGVPRRGEEERRPRGQGRHRRARKGDLH